MIIEALDRFYRNLQQQKKVPLPGWSEIGIHACLDIDADGNLLSITDLQQDKSFTDKKGKVKTKRVSQKMTLPNPVIRTSGCRANIFFDSISYTTGISQKKNSLTHFETLKQTYQELFSHCTGPTVTSLLKYLDRWNPENPDIEIDIPENYWLVFRCNGVYLHKDPEAIQVYQDILSAQQTDDSLPVMTCCITGKQGPIPLIHGKIKGLPGGQSSGVSLVSVNTPSGQFFEHEQNQTSPIAQDVAENYVNALNYLLSHKQFCRIGDDTMLFWTEDDASQYSQMMQTLMAINGQTPSVTTDNLFSILRNLSHGKPADINGVQLDPNENFYILVLTPNGGRAAIKNFQCNQFGDLAANIQAHYDRMAILDGDGNIRGRGITPQTLLFETANKKTANKNPKQNLIGPLLDSILNNRPYPQAMFDSVMRRIRAESSEDTDPCNYRRMAFIKAYLLAQPNTSQSVKEVLTVGLNHENQTPGYVLGRVFATLQSIQYKANNSSNIRAKYFTKAGETPGMVFPHLINLAQAHITTISNREGKEPYKARILNELLDKLGDTYPKRLSLEQQGAFQLGYYHQRMEDIRNAKKVKESGGEANTEALTEEDE